VKLSFKQKCYALAWTIKAYCLNLYAEWRNARLNNKPRQWTAHRIGGGGVVPLGKVDRNGAIKAVAAMGGSVRFVDDEVAVIMYSDDTN